MPSFWSTQQDLFGTTLDVSEANKNFVELLLTYALKVEPVASCQG